ncbi:hypothetical protein KIN20_035374 [Parelaphostrongylus tenuis]|uniref:Spindle assembly checkpoint component MAD1 n=1 Tax=Parelaphostrongylus tenuis TaxID=148309 RepID=A0AAD5RBN1_PARTN|nr:hypothetical protein KIN20_035374 [Parelaphostrongylus tenuis]
MIRRDVRDVDDDDGPSEATIKLTAKMDEKFRRAFPLRGEGALRRPRPIAPPTLSQISRRLNFDDSLGATSAMNSKVKLVELNEEVDSLKRRLNNAHNDIKRLKLLEDSEKKKSEHLQVEIVQLKKEKEMVKQSSSAKLDEVKREVEEVALSRDRWREAATCFYRYFQSTKARLTLAEKEMLSRGLLNEDLRRALTSAWTLSECSTEDIVEESLHELMKNVISTLEELDSKLDEGTGASSASVLRFNEDSELNDSVTAVIGKDNQSLLFNQSESVLNSTLANTSIDYEKDERIQRLELENSRLRDREIVLHERSQKFLLMEEQMRSTEHRYRLLEKSMEEILVEFNSLRSACAKKMFDFTDGASQDRAAEVMKRIQSLSESVEILESELDNARLEAERARKNGEALTIERDLLLENIEQLTDLNENLKCSLNNEKEACGTLKRTVETKNTELSCVKDEVVLLRQHVSELEADLAESESRIAELKAQLKNASVVPTDAGDETQILHFRNNPLQCAVNSLEEAERERHRKRGADTSLGGDEAYERKKAREEQICALESQLKKSEREKEHAIRIQTDIAKKYREISTTLTGYQIKLKDVEEGICCVNSVYDETEKQFVFKFNALTGTVDLLDIGQDESSQGRPWEEEMRKYIGVRHSIPGFLAAVTLQLEARRNLEDDQRTGTISVVHED